MYKLIALTTILTLTACSNNYKNASLSLVAPIAAKHLKERNHADGWNENFIGNSIGASYRHKTGFGATIVYANSNSLRNQATYVTADYSKPIYQHKNYEFSLGASVGVANGYPKKSKGISKTDFRTFSTLNSEACKGDHCIGINFVPDWQTSPTFIVGYKYIAWRF